MTPSPLLQIHIPKTAGTSLFGVLGRFFPPARVYQAVDYPVYIEDLRTIVAGKDLIAGHLTWAATAVLPASAGVLVLLRDPIERALSTISYLRQHVSAGIFEPMTQRLAQLAVERPLAELLLMRDGDLRISLGSLQVAYLSGDDRDVRVPASLVRPDGELDQDETERRFAIAARNLASCYWVATTETLDRDLHTLTVRQGWPRIDDIPRHLASQERLQAENLPAAALQELKRLTEADRELYAMASRMAAEAHRAIA
jgi:hypothetical protein